MNSLRSTAAVLLIAALALFFAPGARADYAVLRSGQRLHIAGYLRQGPQILLYVSGGSVTVSASDVIRFEPEDVFPSNLNASVTTTPFATLIRSAARENGLDEKLLSSVISAESNFNPHAISSAHAMGLMQLMPATATQFGVRNAFDPAQNISAGARYLKELLGSYGGNIALALAAYNAGPQRVLEYRGVPPFPATDSYIRRVTEKLKKANLTSIIAAQR